jgi:hypothetical protein
VVTIKVQLTLLGMCLCTSQGIQYTQLAPALHFLAIDEAQNTIIGVADKAELVDVVTKVVVVAVSEVRYLLVSSV